MGTKKCSIDISEVTALVLECPNCGSSTSYPLNQMPQPNFRHNCHNCAHGLRQDASVAETIGNLRYVLADLLTHYKDPVFRVRLEIKSGDQGGA